MRPVVLGVLGSTRGTHLIHLLDAIDRGRLPAQIAVVVTNRHDALILERAEARGIPAVHISPEGLTREAHDAAVTEILEASGVELVVLAGYMRILGKAFVEHWRGRILNVHPSLLPAFSGLMDRAVHQAVLDAGVLESGCTVHQVTEVVDGGAVVIQRRCPVLPEDTVETLRARVQGLEGEALICAIKLFVKE